MRIAILGATSEIAKDLILSFNNKHQLVLYSRRPAAVTRWFLQINLDNCVNRDISEFSDNVRFDAIINFIGAGNPHIIQRLGKRIFSITESYDQMVLNYLQEHPSCLYIFMSSGAVFGDNFSTPVNSETRSVFPINSIEPQHYYGLAKAQAEYRHRMSDYNIIDLRIFNYFSSTMDIHNSFMICDMMRSILENTQFLIDNTPITRDYVGPKDFHHMIEVLLNQEKINTAIDMYSRLPISKDLLIEYMKERYGLKVWQRNQLTQSATGVKDNYYSTNLEAYSLGYSPTYTSIQTIFEEADKLLKCN